MMQQKNATLLPLLGCTQSEIIDIATQLKMPKFVGKQITEWIYKHHVKSIDEMSNISQKNRALLKSKYYVGAHSPSDAQRSVDGTVKYLFQTLQDEFIETVYLPEKERATICVSCEVGCKMGCAFCMTGRQGWSNALSTTDIINQIFSIPETETLTNIVFMGQGEPFDNLDNILKTTEIMTSEWGYGWSPKRITVSTVGIHKGLDRFLTESKCNLAISLHHPVPSERAEMMPAEKAFSIVEMVEQLKKYDFCRKSGDFKEGAKQRRLSFEYIVFDHLNNTKEHADTLIRLLKDLDCRVNLIRFHDIPDTPFKGVSDEEMIEFRNYLTQHGLFATVRASRGQDIFAACGLLSTAKSKSSYND